MQVQDDEHQRISRELHDSLGQYLNSIKMNLDLLRNDSNPTTKTEILSTTTECVERCITETRTLSHWLHPPLLDETGLASATRWYVEGFAQRSGIEARLDLPEENFRLPALVELSLFRIVQESLTNVHRHSGSTTVEVKVTIGDGQAGLVVRDSGHGIPSEKLERFLQDGANSGVGLGGMRERVNDLGVGHLTCDPMRRAPQ